MKHAKTAVITGAGSGIGLAAALEFAAHGWNVGLIGRGRAALDDADRRVEAAGGAPPASRNRRGCRTAC